jgi:integrase
MTNPSKNPFADPSLMTLGELKERILDMRHIDLQRRRDIASGLTSLAKWIGQPESMIPAAMSYIRPAMEKLHPAQLNVSHRRVQNVSSFVTQAFRLAGLSCNLAPYQTPMAPEWAVLWQPLSTYARTELSRLFRYCSHKGIAPDQISDAVSAAYLQALTDESMVKGPKTRHQSVCRIWNRCVAEHAALGWPQITLSVPRYNARLYGIEEDKVSPGILADLDAFAQHLEGNDPFSPQPKPFRPISVKVFRGHLWRYLSALHLSGMDLTSVASFDDLVTRPMFECAMRWFWVRNNKATSKHIGEIAWAVRVYAVKYRSADEATLAFYDAAMQKLRLKHEGLSPKNQKAMRQFSEEKSVRAFVNLPQKLWSIGTAVQPTAEEGRKRKAALILIQAAVAIEILMFAPVRLKNLCNLRLDQHMSWRQGILYLNIPAPEVKNEVTLDFKLPAETSARIARYIKDWRGLFLPKANPYLFPGRNGAPKEQGGLGKQISKAVFAQTGLTLTPHQFRHTAAKLLLDAKPGHYEVVRKVLGHNALSTTYAHYAGAETEAAVELYDNVILSLKGPNRAAPDLNAGRTNAPRKTGSASLFMDPLHQLGRKRGGKV